MRPLAILAAVFVVLVRPIPLHGQTLTPAAQAELRKAKDEVFVQVAGAPREIHGRLAYNDATALTLVADGRPYTIPFRSVVRIDTMTRRFIGKGAAIGFVTGLAMGAWCAYICGQGSGESRSAAFFGQLFLGTTTGALSSLGARGRTTAYRAESPVEAYAGPLPCPAMPVVVTSAFVPSDRAKWARDEWFTAPEYHALGNARCDGLTVRRRSNEAADTWESGVELHFKDLGNGIVSVTARITVSIAQGDRDKIGVIQIEVLQGAMVIANGTLAIDAAEGRETAGLQNFRVPASAIDSGLSLRLTMTTKYE